MRQILVFGATSAIAEATARCFAVEGDCFYLVGRNETALGDIAQDLKVRGAREVSVKAADLADLDALAALCDEAREKLGVIDVAIVAHGVLPDQEACERSGAAMLDVMRINALSPALLMTRLGEIIEGQGKGTLVVLSSVAGDRGRPSNYVYGASKALLSVLGEGMALKLAGAGAKVLVVKPGFVDTPMTASFAKGALWSSAKSVGEAIHAAVKAGKNGVLYVPSWWRFIMLIVKFAPAAIVRRM